MHWLPQQGSACSNNCVGFVGQFYSAPSATRVQLGLPLIAHCLFFGTPCAPFLYTMHVAPFSRHSVRSWFRASYGRLWACWLFLDDLLCLCYTAITLLHCVSPPSFGPAVLWSGSFSLTLSFLPPSLTLTYALHSVPLYSIRALLMKCLSHTIRDGQNYRAKLSEGIRTEPPEVPSIAAHYCQVEKKNS